MDIQQSKVSSQRHSGFTIVELLIVIIVIAILGAISIVGYNGIQQRAANSATLTTAASFVRLLHLYKAGEGRYPTAPAGDGSWCVTKDNLCSNYRGDPIGRSNDWLMEELRKYGEPPASIVGVHDSRIGVLYHYNTTFRFEWQFNPIMIQIWLKGTNQNCNQVAGMMSVKDYYLDESIQNFRLEDYSNGNADGLTRCYLMFPNDYYED